MEVASIFRANVVDVLEKTMTLEVMGEGEKIDAILQLLRKNGIRRWSAPAR